MSKYKVTVLGVVALVALTGCIGGLGGDGNGNGNGANIDSGNTTTVSVAVGLDSQARQEISQMQILNQSEQQFLRRAQSDPGNLSVSQQQRARGLIRERQQAQRDAQQNALNESGVEFESTVNATETLSIEDSIQQAPSFLYLVSGSPSEIVGLLNQSNVQAIASQEQFRQLQQQQQAPAPGGAPGGAPTP